MDEHPLRVWLDRHHESVVEFSARSGVSFPRVYSLMNGRTKRATAELLSKIQTGTGGEVTVSEMLAWQKQRQTRAA